MYQGGVQINPPQVHNARYKRRKMLDKNSRNIYCENCMTYPYAYTTFQFPNHQRYTTYLETFRIRERDSIYSLQALTVCFSSPVWCWSLCLHIKLKYMISSRELGVQCITKEEKYLEASKSFNKRSIWDVRATAKVH